MSVEGNPLETSPKFQAVSGDRLLFGKPEKFDRLVLRGADITRFGYFGKKMVIL
jgi:hypothetical protein